LQYGEGLGYRWQNDAQTFGFDAIAFHYRRDLRAARSATGTFYGADLDIVDDVNGIKGGFPSNRQAEAGDRRADLRRGGMP